MIDSVERVVADLRSLPPLPDDVRRVYRHGGWNLKGKKPEQFEKVRAKVGKDIHGQPLHGVKVVDRMKETNRRGYDETPPPLEQSSRESTLHLVWQMRRAGWSRDQAFAMMTRRPPLGTAWLLWFRDPGEEFDRCWDKAGRSKKSIAAERAPQCKAKFASNSMDRSKVFTLIELHFDAGQPIHKRGLYAANPLDGEKWKGRIDIALDVLKDEGLVTTEPGPNRSILYSPAKVRPTHRHEPVVDQYGIDDALTVMSLDFDFDLEEEPVTDWRVRAKEIGLLGARRYVSSVPIGGDLSDEDLDRILADW